MVIIALFGMWLGPSWVPFPLSVHSPRSWKGQLHPRGEAALEQEMLEQTMGVARECGALLRNCPGPWESPFASSALFPGIGMDVHVFFVSGVSIFLSCLVNNTGFQTT